MIIKKIDNQLMSRVFSMLIFKYSVTFYQSSSNQLKCKNMDYYYRIVEGNIPCILIYLCIPLINFPRIVQHDTRKCEVYVICPFHILYLIYHVYVSLVGVNR